MSRAAATGVWLWMVVCMIACGGEPPAVPAAAEPVAPMAGQPETDAPRSPAAPARRIVFLGDSLTAGLGLPPDQSYPALIQQRLDARAQGWTVVNAGVSGDTSAGGLRRLEWSIDGGAAILVVALGGNDALRGLPVSDLAKNLDSIVARATAAGARVVVAGMEAPPNNGPDYTAAFRAVYDETARRHHATRIPFLLDGVAGIEALNQADGIHPNREGARLVADTVWRALEPIVRDLEVTPTR